MLNKRIQVQVGSAQLRLKNNV